MDARAFGKWLKSNRTRLELSQDRLAELVSCSPSYISTLERATPHSKTKATIRPDELLVDAFAGVFGRTKNEARHLAGYAPVSDEPDLPLVQLKEILRKAPEDKRPIIERLLERDAENYVSLVLSA